MNPNRVLSVLLAVTCIGAVGVAGSTLESSVETAPDDAVDVDFRRLPIDGDAVAAAKHEIQTRDPGGSTTAAGRVAGASDRTEKLRGQLAGRARSMAGAGGDPADRFPLTLLALLIGLGLLGYRFRDRLRALLPGRGSSDRSSGDGGWPPGEPSTELGRAWSALVRRIDPDRPRSRTVAECTSIAVDRGMDADAVRSLARTVEEVRYGDASLTDARRQCVRRGRRRLELDSEGER